MRTASIPIAAILLVSILCLSACRLQKTYPPQPVKIVGTSNNPAAQTKKLDSRQITASADADVPAQALDPLQGRLMAAQSARQAARRELARKIEAMEIRPGLKIGAVIEKDADKRQKVEELLRQAQQRGTVKSERGRCTVFLAVEVRQLDRLLGQGGMLAETMGSTQPLTREEYRRRLEKEALEDARLRALQFTQGVRLAGKKTVGDVMLEKRSVDHAVRAKIQALPPYSRSYRENGTCEVTLILDVADIRAIVDARNPDEMQPVSVVDKKK